MKKILILIGVICLAIGVFFFIKKSPSSPEDPQQQASTIPETDVSNIQPVKDTKGPQLNNNTINNLQAGSIKLISPYNNQTMYSGSKIAVQYELLAPIKFGMILIDQDCEHFIDDKEMIGKHSFECTLSQSVGTKNMVIQEVVYSPTVEAKNAKGQLNLIAEKTLSVKDIEYYPESTVFVAARPQSPPNGSRTHPDGSINFKVLYSDGTKKEVDATNFTFTFADPTIVSMFQTPREGTVYFDGKKAGTTQLTVRYAGIEKVIPIEVYAQLDPR